MNDADKIKRERLKKSLKIVGICAMVAGIAFSITGIANLINSILERNMPKLFWCFMVGLPMFGTGLMLTMFGLQKEITRFVKNENMPSVREACEEITASIQTVGKPKCPDCGAQIDEGSNFCPNCGRRLTTVCPDCGNQIKTNDKFCDNCGRKI